MGRQVRRVPPNWQHPKDERGDYIPLLRTKFSEVLREYHEDVEQWSNGFRRKFGWNGEPDTFVPIDEKYQHLSYAEWSGHSQPPVASDYMPEFPEGTATHFQMYENTTEGTPISPVMQDPDDLAHWLADNKASAFAGETATYQEWRSMIGIGYAPSGMIIHGEVMSGVAGVARKDSEE